MIQQHAMGMMDKDVLMLDSSRLASRQR